MTELRSRRALGATPAKRGGPVEVCHWSVFSHALFIQSRTQSGAALRLRNDDGTDALRRPKSAPFMRAARSMLI